MRVLDGAISVLNVAAASVSGIGVPGVEPVITSVLELATMVSTMHSNKEDLSKLTKCLDNLIAIDDSGCADDLKIRLAALRSQLNTISTQCKSLADKDRIKRFVMGKDYKEQIGGIRNSIATHIQHFTFYGNISIEKSITSMASKEILAGIKYVPARYNAESTPDMCMTGTRVDIIKEITARLTDPANATQRIIMLSGSAGSGKSTIAKTVASILAEDDHVLAASFFFSRDYAERKEIKFLPGTLSRQLADFDSNFGRLLVKAIDSDRTGILTAEPYLQFKKLVVDLLAQLPPSLTPWIICLDALDECGKDRGQVVLRWLSDSMSQIPTHIRFFLTGRPDVPSYLRFDTLHSLMHQIILDEIDPITVERDIQLYVERSLDGSEWTTRDTWKAPANDVLEITKRAGGLFIFAATAVRYILAGLPQNHPQSSIDYLLKAAPLTDLNGLYYRIVDEAIPLPATGDHRDRDSRDRAVRVLGTILALFEPLDPAALGALLNMDIDSIKRALFRLSAVIRVPEAVGGKIQVIHLSFREFMSSGILDKRPDLVCNTEDQQRLVALHLIRLLQSELRFNICALPSSYLRNIDIPNIQRRLETHIPSYLRYSSRFWVDHLVRIPFDGHAAQEAGQLLSTKFLFWLEVLSLLGMLKAAVHAMSKFSTWTKHRDTVYFASDAKRFMTFFGPAIAQSTPHIYISALALAPTQSVISTTFRPHFPGLLSFLEGQMSAWPTTVTTLEGHTDSVQSVVFSRDGTRIASASDDETLRVWDAESGEAIGEPFKGHGDSVYSVVFSPDGKHLASASEDDTLRVWDVETGDVIGKPFEGHTDSVYSVAFSPNGKYIVSGSEDTTIRIWDAESGKGVGKPLSGHTGPVLCVAFSPDGQHVVSGSEDDTVRVWSVESGEPIGEPLQGHTGSVQSVEFSPDSKYITSGSDDGTLRIWNVESMTAFGAPLEGHTDSVYSVGFSSDGSKIVSGSEDHTICVWDAMTGFALGEPLQGHVGAVGSVAFSPNGAYIVSGSHDTTIRLWTTAGGDNTPPVFSDQATTTRSKSGHGVLAIAFSPHGKYIASASSDTVRLWDVESGQMLGEPLKGHTDSINSVVFSSGGKAIATGSDDGTLRMWDVDNQKTIGAPFEGHTDSVESVGFSADGKCLVSGSVDQTIRIWDVESGNAIGEPLDGHTSSVFAVAFSPDGTRLVSGADDETVCLWNSESGMTIGKPFDGHTDSVNSVAFSPDGKYIATGSDDGTVCVLDGHSGKLIMGPLNGHDARVHSVTFSPDGRSILSGGADDTVRLWDTETGDLRQEAFTGHLDSVTSVAFSPDGKYIASGSYDYTIRVWPTETGRVFDVLTDDMPPSVFHAEQATGTTEYDNLLLRTLSARSGSHWRTHQGWVSRNYPSELLFWLPSQYRAGFWMPHNKLVIGTQHTRFSYANFRHGVDWWKCYEPPNSV